MCLKATRSRRPVPFHSSHSAFHLFSSGATASRISMLVPLLPGEEKPLVERGWGECRLQGRAAGGAGGPLRCVPIPHCRRCSLPPDSSTH